MRDLSLTTLGLLAAGLLGCSTAAQSDGGIDTAAMFEGGVDASHDVRDAALSEGSVDAPDASDAGDSPIERAQVVTSYFWDCTSCPGGRELSPTGRAYRFNRWRFGGREYLILSNYTSANFYDVTNPRNPTLAFAGGPYAFWGIMEGSPDDDTEQWDIALLPDNPTGLAMFQNFGWVVFRISPGGRFWGIDRFEQFRINPPIYIPTDSAARNAALFQARDGKTYAAASYLARRDSTMSIDLADMSDPNALRVVATLPNTGPGGLIRIVGAGSSAYLITTHLNGDGILVFNVANPQSPMLAAQITLRGVSDFDTSQNRLFVVHSVRMRDRPATSSVAAYDLSDPSSPRLLRAVEGLPWQYNNVTGVGNYLIVSTSANETAELPIRVYDVTRTDPPLTFPIEPLGGTWLYQTEQDTVVYDAGDALVLYRAAYNAASVTVIPKSCVVTGC